MLCNVLALMCVRIVFSANVGVYVLLCVTQCVSRAAHMLWHINRYCDCCFLLGAVGDT